MTEQYRDGSDDDFFFLTSSQHTAMKRISFLSPFTHPYFSILLLPKEKKEREKKTTHFHIFSIQSNPVQFAAPISSSRSKKKKEEHRKTSPLPFPSLLRSDLPYIPSPNTFPPYSPFTEIRLSLSLSKPLQVPMSSEVG